MMQGKNPLDEFLALIQYTEQRPLTYLKGEPLAPKLRALYDYAHKIEDATLEMAAQAAAQVCANRAKKLRSGTLNDRCDEASYLQDAVREAILSLRTRRKV